MNKYAGRRRLSFSGVSLLGGILTVLLIRGSSAFVLPQQSSPLKIFVPSSIYESSTHRVLVSERAKEKWRRALLHEKPGSTPLLVSLDHSSAPAKEDEATEVLGDSEHPLINETNATPDILSEDMETEPEPVELIIPMEDPPEMMSIMEDKGVQGLATRVLSDDEEVDVQEMLASPSVPVSYDVENGLVQAEATLFDPTLDLSYAVPIDEKDEQDYPQFIKLLFEKDANGQNIASKLFNFALLAASFGYVFVSVFNIDSGMTRGWAPSEIGMRIPLDTWASYENSLSEKPVATKTIINIVIYLLGDWLSQTLFQNKNVLDFDAARTLKNGLVGMFFGPAVHEYYEFSDWILPVEGVTIGITNRAFKILMDQTIYLSVKCSIYIMAIGLLNGDSLGDSSENVKNRIKPIMFTAWKFWPLVHCVTYGLIPARHRILWVNSVDLVWNAILASKARDDDVDIDEEGDDTSSSDDLDIDEVVLEANSDGSLGLAQGK